MELTEQTIEQILHEQLQPKVRVDGGDIEFERLDGDTVFLGAHAECAACPAAPERLQWWCQQEFDRLVELPCRVVVTTHKPYYEQYT